jgi:hypothetical protein
MLFLSLFRHLNSNLTHARKDRPRRRRQRLRRLLWLEALEDRTVPSTLTVTSIADDGSAGTLRAVLASASSGDSIQFANNLNGKTITLSQGELLVNQSMTIAGPGSGKLTINGNAAGRIFDIASGATVTISDLTLSNGLATDGTAVLNAGNLTLSDDDLSVNVAQGIAGGGLFGDGIGRGGGVENEAGATLAVSQSTFTGNEALGSANGGNALGGAIYNEAGTVTIDGSTFTGNQALGANGGSGGVPTTLPGGVTASLLGDAGGAGIWNDGGSLKVTNSTLSNNLTLGGTGGNPSTSPALANTFGDCIGGGIGDGAFFTTATPSLTVTGSTLTGNEAQGIGAQGGGIAIFVGNASISNSSVSGNLAEVAGSLNSGVSGGGIYDAFGLGFAFGIQPPTLSITGCTIDDNVAQSNNPSGYAVGGGVNVATVNAGISNSTLDGNQVIGGPGGGFIIPNGVIFYLPGGGGQGGGIASGGDTLTVSGCTLNDNLAQGGAGDPANVGGSSGFGGYGEGGGIESGFDTLVLTNSTLSGNQAVGGAGTNGSSGGGGAGGGLFMILDTATVSSTTFTKNLAQSAPNSPGALFSPESVGGAVSASTFTSLQLTSSTFTANQVIGDTGGAGINGGAGGPGGAVAGGALEVDGFSTATIDSSSFAHNLAQGGAGGTGDTGGAGGTGGGAMGGAFATTDPTVTISNSSFDHDVAQAGAGGAGGAGANGGAGGNAQGGGIYNAILFGTFFGTPALLMVTDSTITHEDALGGAGGAGGTGGVGGNGGNGEGGGLFNSATDFLGNLGQATLTVTGCDVSHDLAEGGAGASGANGGNGSGGGIFNDVGATTTVMSSTITHDRADGGAAGKGDSAGQGIGGGLYNLGTATVDAATIFAHNDASTSNDNTFGV